MVREIRTVASSYKFNYFVIKCFEKTVKRRKLGLRRHALHVKSVRMD